MSVKFKNENFIREYCEDYIYCEKNSQLFNTNLIEYKIGKSNESHIDYIRRGYEEMAKINLELSELNIEQEYADINEYEKWLCGV